MTDANYTDVPGVGVVPGNTEDPPVVSFGEMARLKPGAKFVARDDSTKTVRERPQQLTISEDQYAELPEGAQFVAADDPKQTLRTKPAYEGIDFTAQTLYDMAVTDKERKKALERSYPGKVKEAPDGLYVEDDGKFRKPGRGLSSVTGFAASAAAPTTGAVLGALGGGAAGLASPIPGGAFVGGTVGGGTGAMLGQQFNDIILGLAGVYDPDARKEHLVATGEAGLAGMAGAGVGRGIATVVPSIKAGVSAASAVMPSLAKKVLGARPGEITQARELSEQGVLVPPSAVFHEAPHAQNIAEVFDPAFRTNKPIRESVLGYYEKSSKQIADDLGVERDEPFLTPTKDVPKLAAGEAIRTRALNELAEQDRTLSQALVKRAEELRAGLPEKMAQRESLQQAAEESRNAAQKLIDAGFKNIEHDADAAFKVAKAGAYSGDLWEGVGQKLRAVRQGIAERAKYWYDRYDEMTGGATVSSQELSSSARSMIEELPSEFKSRNPALVQKLEKLGVQHGEDGELLKEAEQLTYGQLHDLRSLFRGSADWHTLSSDFKNGSLKHFSNEIDRLIHDPQAPAQVQAAGRFLDGIDKWYGHNIKIFNAAQIKAVVKGLEAGEPADAANLYNAVVKEGHTDLIERVRKMVGPNLWSGVKAADTRAMLDASQTLEPGVIDAKKFAREVLERKRNGTLNVVHGADAEKLLAQARAIEQLDGKLPIPAAPTDTMTQVIARARMAAETAKAEGTKDPLNALRKEIAALEKQNTASARSAQLQRGKNNDPLNFWYNPSVGAIAAVEKTLASEDLVLAAASKFGENSKEFNLLRRIYVQQLLEKEFNIHERMAHVSPEVQRLMFPGATAQQVNTLVKNMRFLTDSRTFKSAGAGASMSAFHKVEQPAILTFGAGTGFALGGPVGAVAGAATAFAARAALTQAFAIFTKMITSPVLMRYVEKGLTGTPEQRLAVKALTDKVLQKGAAVGAGAAEATYQGGLQ